jgi:hypothetical protein
MLGPRYELILTSALALILAVPLGSVAKDPDKPAAASLAFASAEQGPTLAAIAIATPANEEPNGTPSEQATTADQTRRTLWHRSIPPTALSRKRFATSSPRSWTDFLPARKRERRSQPSTRVVISRRFGSTRAARMHAPYRSSPASRVPMPTGSNPAIIGYQALQASGRTLSPRPSLSSLTRCSPLHDTCRQGAFLTPA